MIIQTFKHFCESYQDIKIDHSVGSYQEHPDHIEIASIRTPQKHRGRGSAHKVMKHITDYADKVKKPIKLVASPLDKKTKTDKLVLFYKKHGFHLTGEKANILGDPWMKREAN
jgi:predicted GNAT family acetyltransferase